MNYNIHTFILLIAMQHIPCHGIATCGFLAREEITENTIHNSQSSYASDEKIYTSGTGGAVFTYPTDLFTLPPVVQVSVKSNISHPATEAYVAEISASSATSTTVMVYKISSGVITEAASNDITVCLLAIANPT